MFQQLYQILFFWGMFSFVNLGNNAFAETSPDPSPPIVGMLNLPPVTPQEATEFLNKRVVPPSSLSTQTNAQEYAEKESIKLNIDTILSHEPPVGEITKYGFKRANFGHEFFSSKVTENTLDQEIITTIITPKPQKSPEHPK
ncbi:hypothetical protein [Xenorhabdus innexi]|uniref:Uncharacterized protein n=1 Tax=Xenorhabdus innexi TaxID=290109 RepID=A0A1N6MX60_9GAMM|nr:hypothetical protein [Xenorhabdus innexi]PHM23775.1 hypothetical protein Xinn_04102 [Xenorhabdus innexi]SIP73453.1 conserved exported hypothetical protein [Xenorhabdus innexi]